MNKETHKKLTKNFPKEVVKKAPQGKFGDYVPHHIYTQRLVDVIPGGYDYTYEVIRGANNSIIGAKCKLYIKESDQTIEEVGDVDANAVKRNITESELLKLAVSDGIKRCCMRLGIGLELWTGGLSEEEHYSEVKEVKPTTNTNQETKKAVGTINTPSPAQSPTKQISDAGFSDRRGDKHPNGELAIDKDGLICPCGSNARVKYYKADEKSKPNRPDFRCQAMGQCTAGDTVDGKVFAKSWWMDNKATPESWKDFAAVQNGMTLPKAKSLDEIKEGEAPF